MTLAELQQKANTKLAAFWTLLKTKQENYLIKHDNYFQLLISPQTPVIDGADTPFTLRIPSDIAVHTVDIDFPWTDLIPFQIVVNVWGGQENNRGFEATVTAQLPDGRIFSRSRKLIDPRERKQDFDRTDPENPVPLGAAYYVGSTVEEDTGWFQVIPG